MRRAAARRSAILTAKQCTRLLSHDAVRRSAHGRAGLSGRTRYPPGAVLTRVAASHIRVGTFQLFAARGEQEKVRRLADYVIARHYPELKDHADPYLGLLVSVCHRQAALIASWMHVGFIHGVMNTDNMAISGETIDYGPCAFMDHYDRATVVQLHQRARYAIATAEIASGAWRRFVEALDLDRVEDRPSPAPPRWSMTSPNRTPLAFRHARQAGPGQ